MAHVFGPDGRQLHALAEVDFGRFRVWYGGVDQWALTATFDFPKAQFSEVAFDPENPTEALRTALHEITHVSQVLATPYGYYTQLVRDFQSHQILRIIHGLNEAGVGLRQPLARTVQGLPADDERFDEVRHDLYAWYLAELLMLFHEHGVDTYADILLSGAAAVPSTIAAQFAELNFYLHEFCRHTGRSGLAAADPRIAFTAGREELERRESPIVAMKFFGSDGSFDAESVMESGARAAEFWARRTGDARGMLTVPGGPVTTYDRLIHDAIDVLRPRGIDEFATTYAVIADLALHPPVLPQHAAWSELRQDAYALLPHLRAGTLLRAARGIAPVRDLARDYGRFVTEVCGRCGWPTPAELAEAFTRADAGVDADMATGLYRMSLDLRRRVPHVFNDLDVWLGDSSEAAAEVRYYFVQPVMQFSDGLVIHRDKALAGYFILNTLTRRWLRHCLLTRDLTVRVPYTAVPEEVEFWTELLRDQLAEYGLVGVPVRLRAPDPTDFHRAPART